VTAAAGAVFISLKMLIPEKFCTQVSHADCWIPIHAGAWIITTEKCVKKNAFF
jgi:hypothetical protein